MKKLSTFLLLFIAFQIYAQAPAGYYTDAVGKKDAELKTALYGIIGGPDVTSYSGLWTAFRNTDKRTDGKVWDIYSNTTNYVFGDDQCGNYGGEGDCYNREHSFPKSWFNDASPMYSDLYHLYPSDGYTNGRRSNYAFGEVGSISWSSNNQFSKLGASNFTGYSGTVFEPNDLYKGDLARTYFYMVTAYENRISSWNSPHLNGTSYPGFNSWSIELLLKWHRQDPVSQKEIDRNNAINYGHQSNRNPFIDYPELAEHIWGNRKGMNWSATEITEPTLINPRHGTTIDFGNVPYQQVTLQTVELRAINLTGDLTISLSSLNSTFSTPVTTITKSEAEAGYTLTFSVNPQTTGIQNATLTVSGGGIASSTIQLTANSTSQFLALPATDIAPESFTANWTLSDGALSYILNVYTYSHTGVVSKTLLEETFNIKGLPSGWSKIGYMDNNEAGSARLASGSSNGGITTPALDLSVPTTLKIVAKSWLGDNSDMYIQINGAQYSTITLTNDFMEYIIELPAFTSSSTITILANKNKRLYVDNVIVATEGTSEVAESLPGYPQNVGNVLSHSVTGLTAESTYYYTVTPHGNGTAMSDEIEVRTSVPTDTKSHFDIPELIAYFAGSTLYVSNLEPGSKLTIFSVLGNKISEHPITSNEISLPFNYKGIFILQVSNNERITGIRKMILH